MAKILKFKPGIYQNPTHFTITDVSGNIKDIKPNFGTIIQQGTPFSSATFNLLSKATTQTVVDTSSLVNKFVVSVENLLKDDLDDNLKFILVPNTTNAGDSTLNPESLGEISIYKEGNKPLQAGDIVKKQQAILNYNSEYNCFELLNPQRFETTEFENKTYTELKLLKDGSSLKEGKRYLLSDYATKYQQPTTDVIKEMPVESLVLTASSSSTFEPIVYSSTYPQDTIWYDFDNAICEDNTTPRNGFVLRRYDSITGNDCPQDWRSILWARWTVDANEYYLNGVLTPYEVWTSGNAKKGVLYKANNKLYTVKFSNVPESATDGGIFKIVLDLTSCLLTEDKTKIANKIELKKGILKEVKTFGTNCTNNKIRASRKNKLHNNVFLNNCADNSFGNGCFDNSFGNNCTSNSLETFCYRNNFNDSCTSNSFGNLCVGNGFGDGCSNNSFIGNCSYNGFIAECSYNSFDISCSNNGFDCECTSNSLGSNSSNNSLGNFCHGNRFGNSCYGNTFDTGGTKLVVKALRNKDTTQITTISNADCTITLEEDRLHNFIFWYIESGNISVHQIP